VLKITFVSAHGYLFNRLPEIFHRPDVRITVIGCPSTVLSTSPFVDRFIPIGKHSENETFVSDLIASGVLESAETLGDWVIVAGDDELRELAQSDLPDERVLFRGTVHGFMWKRSKSG